MGVRVLFLKTTQDREKLSLSHRGVGASSGIFAMHLGGTGIVHNPAAWRRQQQGTCQDLTDGIYNNHAQERQPSLCR